MNNLEQIKKAWAMGWSAIWEGMSVIAIQEQTIVLIQTTGICYYASSKEINENGKITGYKYAGELAGNEPIPEGQKFRVKKTGKIIEMAEEEPSTVRVREISPDDKTLLYTDFDKSEIEPVFN